MTAHPLLEHEPSPGDPPQPTPWPPTPPPAVPEPVPVLAPYFGVLGSALCALTGAWLLLAPYALDYRNGAGTVPRATVVDLATGGAAGALGLASAALFGAAIVRRLRSAGAAGSDLDAHDTPIADLFADRDPGSGADLDDSALDAAHETGADARDGGHAAGPGADSLSRPDGGSGSGAPDPLDPGGSLRDLLTPLVAALAADLRSRDVFLPDPAGSSAADHADRPRSSSGFPGTQDQGPAQEPATAPGDEPSMPPHRLPRTPPPRTEW